MRSPVPSDQRMMISLVQDALAFNVDVSLERITSSTVNDLDVPEQDLVIRIRALNLIILRLERRIELHAVMRVHRVHLAAIDTIALVAVDAIHHDTTIVDRRRSDLRRKRENTHGKVESAETRVGARGLENIGKRDHLTFMQFVLATAPAAQDPLSVRSYCSHLPFSGDSKLLQLLHDEDMDL